MTEYAAPANAPPPLVDHGSTVGLRTNPVGVTALARAFVEAFNDRDADALVGLAHRDILFRPTALIGRRRVYHGHAGLRRWVADLDALPSDVRLHVRDIRPQRPDGFLVLSTLRVGGDPVADAAMIAAVQAGRIVEAHGYLSDESTLVKLGLIVDAPSALAEARATPSTI
jgi:SnoaL-like domain